MFTFLRYDKHEDNENSLDLYNVNYGENELDLGYDMLNILLDLHGNDHKISKSEVVDPSRQTIPANSLTIPAEVSKANVFTNRRYAAQ